MKTLHGIRYGLIGMAVLAAFGMGGCKPQEGAAGKEGAAEGAKKYKIAGIIMQEDEFFRLVQYGMQEAADQNGVELLNATSGSLDKEIELVNTYAAQGVDAIVIAPTSKDSSAQALKLAADKGIKIVCANTPISADFIVSDIESDAVDLGTQTGKEAVKFINEKLGGKANVAIVAFQKQVPEQSNARVKGFKDEIAKLPGVKIIAEQDAWLPDMAQQTVNTIMTAHPEVNVIWSANEGGTVGSVLAVKGAGKQGKVFVFGTDSSDQLIGFLQSDENILQAITSQKPVEVGKMAVEYAVKALKGDKDIQKQVILKGTCLTRTDPAGVEAFKKQLAEWKSKG